MKPSEAVQPEIDLTPSDYTTDGEETVEGRLWIWMVRWVPRVMQEPARIELERILGTRL